MSDYIKREEITGLLQSVIDANEDFDTDNSRAQNDVLMWLEEQIPKIPSADVEPVRHGRWEGKTYKCSLCGKWVDPLQGDADMNYCPNCGAKMDGDK